MLTYPAGLEVQILARASIYIRTLCMRAAKDLASMCICADSPEHSPRVNGGGVGGTLNVSWYVVWTQHLMFTKIYHQENQSYRKNHLKSSNPEKMSTISSSPQKYSVFLNSPHIPKERNILEFKFWTQKIGPSLSVYENIIVARYIFYSLFSVALCLQVVKVS